MREMKELLQIKKFFKTMRCLLGSGAYLHMESFLSFQVHSHEIALLEKRQKEEVAEPAEQETNKHLSVPQTTGLPQGPRGGWRRSGWSRKQSALHALALSGKRIDLPTNHPQDPEGPPRGTLLARVRVSPQRWDPDPHPLGAWEWFPGDSCE